MDTAVTRGIFVSVLLLSVLCTCVSEEREKSCPKLCSALPPVQQDAWWMVYVRDSATHNGSRKGQGTGAVSSRVDGSMNVSKVKVSITDRDGSRIGDSVESDFEWQVARNMSDQVVEGRVRPDKWSAVSREAEGEGAAEERRFDGRNDGINVGEYCW